MKKIICFGSPTNCRVFGMSNLCQSVNGLRSSAAYEKETIGYAMHVWTAQVLPQLQGLPAYYAVHGFHPFQPTIRSWSLSWVNPTEQFLQFRSLVLRSLQWFLRKTAKAGTSEYPQRAGTQGHLKSHSCLCSLSALVSWLDRWCFDSTSDQAQRVSSAVGLLPLCLSLLLRQ